MQDFDFAQIHSISNFASIFPKLYSNLPKSNHFCRKKFC